jgi:hypothetical protein
VFKVIQVLIATLMLLAASLSSAEQSGSPSGEDADVQRLVGRMLKAHGCMNSWREVETIRFDHILSIPFYPNEPWVRNTTIERSSGRVYQDWPLDEARLVFDGENVWTTKWKKLNPPAMMPHVFYRFLHLPWLSADPSVSMEYSGLAKLPESEVEYECLLMRFDDAAHGRH